LQRCLERSRHIRDCIALGLQNLAS
jgi:hypothetical protein